MSGHRLESTGWKRIDRFGPIAVAVLSLMLLAWTLSDTDGPSAGRPVLTLVVAVLALLMAVRMAWKGYQESRDRRASSSN